MKCSSHPEEEMVVDDNQDAWCLLCIVEARNKFMLKQLQELDPESDLNFHQI